jgi:hypothetical protein
MHASQHNRAGANLLLSLCIRKDTELKVWYAEEAVRIFKLILYTESKEAKEPSIITRAKAAYADDVLEMAHDAHNAYIKLTSSRPTTPPQQTISAANPATPPTTPRPGRNRHTSLGTSTGGSPEIRFELPANSNPTPLHYDPAPAGLNPTEVQNHRRTFKVMNQARRAFHQRNYAACERTCLALLRLPDLSIWQQARCHVFLARIPYRDDRAARARRALLIYRQVEVAYAGLPGVGRAREAREQAEAFLGRVVGVIGEEEARGGYGGGEIVVRGGDGDKTDVEEDMGANRSWIWSGWGGNESEDVSDVEEYETEPSGSRSRSGSSGGKRRKDRDQQAGFVAGVVGTMASLLGLKRRRDEDDDSEDSTGGRERRQRAWLEI